MMFTALRLEADGVPVAWIDAETHYSRFAFRQALKSEKHLGAVFINDADIYDGRLTSMVVDAIEHDRGLLVVCEVRSTKVDRALRNHEISGVEVREYTIPVLGDGDIDAILDVLDREHRLGELKGLSRDARRRVFQSQAGRQLLVAMHFATFGRDFEEKVRDELKDMTVEQQAVYGLVGVASAHRFALRQDDIGIACGDQGTAWLQVLSGLVRRKLIVRSASGTFRARHRMIAQFIYDSLIEDGRLFHIAGALVRIGATKTTLSTPRHSQHVRLLRTFTNHNFLTRAVGVIQGRQIYADFEDALSWNYHYWLHRGALELENGNLDLAENFLNQAKSINDGDIFVDNELAYLCFKKANERPTHGDSPALVEEAIETLDEIVRRRPDQIAHAYHIMGQQGLIWAENGLVDSEAKRVFLEYLARRVKRAVDVAGSQMMRELYSDVRRAILSLAVLRKDNAEIVK